MKKATSFLLAATLGLFYLCQTEPARAATVSSPWPNVSVGVVIAAVKGLAWGDGQYAIFKRAGSNMCSFTKLGQDSQNGLTDDWAYIGGSATDSVLIPSSNGTYCYHSYTPLNYNGHYVDLYGNAGNDGLTSGYGDTYLYGGTGDDTLNSCNPIGYNSGGDGNDILYTFNGNGESLHGDAGDDCLSDSNSSAAAFDCGAGADMYTGNPVNRVGCETWTPYCWIP